MANTLSKIEVAGEFKHLQIKEFTENGKNFRRVLTPDMTLAVNEHQVVKDKAEELWTDEVKASWTKFQEEQQAEVEGE